LGSQHIHGQIWTSLLPSVLADLAHDDELLRVACAALDSQLCAELPLDYLAAGAAFRALKKTGVFLPSRRDAAVALPESDEDFLHHARLVVLFRNFHEHRLYEILPAAERPGLGASTASATSATDAAS
jgi:hypothetical protein